MILTIPGNLIYCSRRTSFSPIKLKYEYYGNGISGEYVVIDALRSKIHPLAVEFLRYIFVGGTAFLVDCGVLYITRTFILAGESAYSVYIATALGFTAGLIYNYLLSLSFVFKSARERNKGKSVGAFLLFAVIGIIGLGLTEAGMYLLFGLLDVHYLIAKVFIAGVVLVWNYAARKLLIFK